MPTIRVEEASKHYKWEGRIRAAVNDVSITIEQGEFVFFVGSSGAGKSTLLHMMAGDTRPTSGAVYLDALDLAHVPSWRRPRLQLCFGEVWQEPRLMRKRTIDDNLSTVARMVGGTAESQKARVSKVLGIVGMAGVEERYPGELSIGENRRVELARALVNSPPILMLDELTANLDGDNIWDILHLLIELNRQGTTILMATHNRQIVNVMRRRVVTMVDGRIFGDVRKGKYGDVV